MKHVLFIQTSTSVYVTGQQYVTNNDDEVSNECDFENPTFKWQFLFIHFTIQESTTERLFYVVFFCVIKKDRITREKRDYTN